MAAPANLRTAQALQTKGSARLLRVPLKGRVIRAVKRACALTSVNLLSAEQVKPRQVQINAGITPGKEEQDRGPFGRERGQEDVQ